MASTKLPFSKSKNLGSQFGHSLRKDFLFDPNFLNLNHGSFGTYTLPVSERLQQLQKLTEARPDPFIRYDYPLLLDEARSQLANLLKTPINTIVFVPNATTGINTVLRNLVYEPGDTIIEFETIYGACEKTIEYICETTPAERVKITYTFPVSDAVLMEKFNDAVRKIKSSGKTPKLAIFDTVVSMPGVRMPFERLTKACKAESILSCIDGAHGVGMLGSELDLGSLDCDFFVSNCHKWLLVPRGCAIFYVAERNQHLIRSTLPTSHGFIPIPKPGVPPAPNPLPQSNKPDFVANFEFVGTIDNSPYLCVPTALEYRAKLGGEDVIKDYMFSLARQSGRLVSKILETEVMENEEGTLGNCSFSNVLLPLKYDDIAEISGTPPKDKTALGIRVRDWLSIVLYKEFDTFMALIWYGDAWWVRLSAQIYLEIGDFERAGKILLEVCKRVEKGEFIQKKAIL